MKVHELIRQARSRRGWSQTELAKRLGTHQSAIARWEHGIASPTVKTLIRILEACGLRLDIALADEGEVDRDQLRERLQWTPRQRLRYLTDIVAFEERARKARRR